MKHSIFLIILLLTGVTSTNTFAAPEHPQLKAFPEAVEGRERFVITLPYKERAEEDSLKVELVPGKTMVTDGINVMRHSSRIESRPLTGWGYTFYEITGQDITISTKVAVPDGLKKEVQFVAGESLMISYNSRLPIVIYTPSGYDIHYRIWQAPTTFEAALK